jgi:hypothetical protein
MSLVSVPGITCWSPPPGIIPGVETGNGGCDGCGCGGCGCGRCGCGGCG